MIGRAGSNWNQVPTERNFSVTKYDNFLILYYFEKVDWAD